MASKVFQRFLDKVPQEEKILMKMHSEIIFRLNQIFKEKSLKKDNLFEKLGENHSETLKWLSGEKDFTLESLAKLEAELEETILTIEV